MKVDTSRILMQGKIETIGETAVMIAYKGKKIKLPVTVL